MFLYFGFREEQGDKYENIVNLFTGDPTIIFIMFCVVMHFLFLFILQTVWATIFNSEPKNIMLGL